MASVAAPSNALVRLVVYCDEEPEPHTLPEVRLPRTVEGVKRWIEEKVGQRAKLLSYWNYAHNRYELLRDVRELLQEDGLISASSAHASRSASRIRGGGKSENSAAAPSDGASAEAQPPRVYRCQLWLETILLQLEPLDPVRDKAEYDELTRHVARWLGNKHISYQVHDAVRVRCPFLTRMFDETRRSRLEGNQDKVQLLYYSNNVWSVRDVLQYGFLLNKGVPKSMTAVVQAQGNGSDISSTTDTRLSIPVPNNAPSAAAQGSTSTSQSAALSSPTLEEALNSQAHPFIFTSSMLGPNVKHLPGRKASHKVLLCEVAPGRRFMTDQSLTGEQSDKQSFPHSTVKTPRGYDSVCYMRTRDDKTAVQSGDEASAMAEDLAIVQLQVGHSYQALPRYLLTVAPAGVKPPPTSSFDSTVSVTSSPIRMPGLATPMAAATAAAAAAVPPPQAAEAFSAASTPQSSRSHRLKEWFTSSPFKSQKKSHDSTGNGGGLREAEATPHRRPETFSAPADARSSPRRDTDGVSRPPLLGSTTPRRAASAVTPPRQYARTQFDVDTPYSDYYSPPRESSVNANNYRHNTSGARYAMAAAVNAPQPRPLTAFPSTSRYGGAEGRFSAPQQPSPYRDARSSAGAAAYGYNGSPLRALPSTWDAHTATPPRQGGTRSLAPPTPPSATRPDVKDNARNGLLYSGLQPSGRTQNNARSGAVGANGGVYASRRESESPLRSATQRSGVAREDGGWLRPASVAEGQGSESYRRSGSSGNVSSPQGPPPLPPPSSSILRPHPAGLSTAYSAPSAQATRAAAAAAPLGPPAAFNQFLCAVHPRQLQSLYCTVCEELTCPYCASVGDHRDHVVVEASDQVTAVHAEVHQLHEELRHWLSQYKQTEQELRAEQASWAARQQRELRSLQQNFATLKQALQQAERGMLQTVQQRSCPPPLAEATAVLDKYTQALAPIDVALKRYHAAFTSAPQLDSQAPAAAINNNNSGGGAGRGATRSMPEMLHFLRTAPALVRRVQGTFTQQHKEEERRLRDGITSYHARVAALQGTYDHVDWVGLRRLLEHIGTSRSTRAASNARSGGRQSPFTGSPPRVAAAASLSFSGIDGGGTGSSRAGSAVRVRSRPSQHPSPTRVIAVNRRDGTQRVVNHSPIRKLTIGDEVASYVSHSTSSLGKRDRLLLRCLEDLQRGHIWAIENASFYFAPGQLKAVCSTTFRLLGAQWELRIAPLPLRQRGARLVGSASTSALLVAPGVNTGMMATTASTVMPGNADGDGEPTAARSPLATQSLPDEPVTSDPESGPFVGRPPEEEWLGLFLFPQEHALRMDFRVIAFSEVTWAEWQVTGWTPEMSGKGWGLYPFLQRKELMRTDKLARDNVVKICIAPISDLY